ncbi:MAG TPA: Rid family hydrolase [Candidatus Ratteibacteria bacterium]|nr:Rid family hydrolase [Candidatus Ratteibacteria bacterium]
MSKKIISYTFNLKDIPVSVNFSYFTGVNRINEYHITIVPTKYKDIYEQTQLIQDSYRKTLKHLNINPETVVFKRFFFSDIYNQYKIIKNHPFINPKTNEEKCAISLISQPPCPPAKIALWAYHIQDKNCTISKYMDNSIFSICRDNIKHFWDTNITSVKGNTISQQTFDILDKYNSSLEKRNMKLASNVVRTWFFIKDIDSNYKDFTEARKNYFEEKGLTPQTHFITSTGVEGESVDINAKLSMDAYSISGIQSQQIEFLRAPEYISPTYVYGVTFERGSIIKYNDRKHIFISGTASINNKGEIVYPGDILKQFEHTLKNIEILLNQAGAGFKDVCIFIVYIRDITDVQIIHREMRKRFKDTPFILVLAKVCRPGWLIEIECQAALAQDNQVLPEFL